MRIFDYCTRCQFGIIVNIINSDGTIHAEYIGKDVITGGAVCYYCDHSKGRSRAELTAMINDAQARLAAERDPASAAAAFYNNQIQRCREVLHDRSII